MESVSKETLQRLPGYLRYLKEMNESGIKSISSTAIADRFGFSAVQVRKDLASVSAEGGKPKTGFSIEALIEDINEFLGYNNVQGAILVGV
ncbi:MAG: winged-helix domain-containing protein, partial [Clostridia bacterium]